MILLDVVSSLSDAIRATIYSLCLIWQASWLSFPVMWRISCSRREQIWKRTTHVLKVSGLSVIPTIQFGPCPYLMKVVSMNISLPMHSRGLDVTRVKLATMIDKLVQ